MEKIVIKGAREHNLKNIDVEIPKNKLVVFTGVSGSGKSSLAFDTIYAEGQRRYVESLSSYARQFLGVMDKPDVDYIGGLSPAISIDQKSASHNPRSTVGTITEIYDYLRLLFARLGHPHCPNCGREIAHLSIQQIADSIASLRTLSNDGRGRFLILAPLVKGRKGEYLQLFNSLRSKGITKVRVDRQIFDVDEDILLLKNNQHDIEAVIDKFTTDTSRLRESVERGLKMSNGEIIIAEVLDASLEFPDKPQKMADHLYSERFACPRCNISLSEIQPRLFSFNSPEGACPTCTGLGYLLKVDPQLVINPELSILEGGILPIGNEVEHDTWFIRMIKAVAKKDSISLISPISNIGKTQLEKILYGTGEEEIFVEGTNRQGNMTSFYEKFEGVIPRLERLYKETASDWRRYDIEKYMRNEQCPSCHGARLKPEALAVTLNDQNIFEVTQKSIRDARNFLSGLGNLSSLRDKQISQPILKELHSRLQFLIDVGLDYLTLGRSANSLAGGEAQRIRLASQIGSGLSGVLYVLDEPSIGLHQRDNDRLIKTLSYLRDLGNTVIVVEHDREMMERADFLFDFGPGAGEHGGEIVAAGTPEEIKKNPHSITGKYLSGKKQIKLDSIARLSSLQNDTTPTLTIVGAREHNLKNITVDFPLGKLIGVTGVSGSGKSSLIHDCLYQALAAHFYPGHKDKPGAFDYLRGEDNLDKVILIDQSPIGRTPRSNPATYTGAFTPIRELFSLTREARIKGYHPGRFSFNVKGGRCEACQGEGEIKIEMQFLPDVYVKCEECLGKRYNADALEILYKNKNIAEVLDMTVEEAREFFNPVPAIREKLMTLVEVGLGYIKLGQSAPTLSGGEAQRVKLATELSKKATGKTLYILDEPTTGLHFADLEKLLWVLRGLVNKGNTVIVIEHNLDVVKNADYLIDLGPEGGENGGEVVAAGTPKEVSGISKSWTGQYLKKIGSFLVLLLVAVFLTAVPVSAAAPKFAVSTEINYAIAPDGQTTVTQNFALTNLANYLIPKEYTISLGPIAVSQVRAFSQNGFLKVETTAASGEAQLKVALKGTDAWTLIYQTPDFAKKIGRLWEILAPQSLQLQGLKNVVFNFSIPPSFGKEVIKNRLYDPSNSEISYQAYDFALESPLVNDNFFPVIRDVSILVNNPHQKVFLTEVDPEPFLTDRYFLFPKTSLTVTIKGSLAQVLDKNSPYQKLGPPFIPVDKNLDLK